MCTWVYSQWNLRKYRLIYAVRWTSWPKLYQNWIQNWIKMNLWERKFEVAFRGSKVTTTLTGQVVDLNCEGSAVLTWVSSLVHLQTLHYVFRSIVALHSFRLKLCSVKYIIHCLIHEFGDMDMPMAVAQLGHVQEHPQDPPEVKIVVRSLWLRAAGRFTLQSAGCSPANSLKIGLYTGCRLWTGWG